MNTFNTITSPIARNAHIMYLALATPGNHILMFYGRNGIAKSTVLEQVGLALGVEGDRIYRSSLAQESPEGLRGWPVPSDDGMKHVMPAVLQLLNDGRPALWIVDEIGDAPRSNQAAAHLLMDTRRFGDDRVKPSLKIVGAMNPPDYSTDAQEAGYGFVNRSIPVPFESPSRGDFVRYRNRRGAPQPFMFPQIDAQKREDMVMYLNGVAAAFFGTEDMIGHPNAVLEENPKDADVAARWPLSFATPRSWDNALNLAATCLAIGDRGAMQVLMTGAVGEPQALTFCAFEAKQDLINGLEAAKNPKLFTPDPKRPDRTFSQLMVVMQSVTDARFKGKEAGEWWGRGWDFIRHCRNFGGAPWSVVSKGAGVCAGAHLGDNIPKTGALLEDHEELIAELAPLVRASN